MSLELQTLEMAAKRENESVLQYISITNMDLKVKVVLDEEVSWLESSKDKGELD